MRVETWTDGKLTEQWDDTSRTYTSWDADGEITQARAFTAEENTAADARLAEAESQAFTVAELDSKLDAALAANQAFLALASPTAAQVRDQTRLLTRQMNAAIRYSTGRFDSTDGT